MAPEENKGKNKRGVQSRKVAVEVLTRIETTGAYANLALDVALDKAGMEARDSAFTTALVQGVLRHKSTLDDEISALSSQPINKIKPPVLNLLRIAIFQLSQMEDIPQRAVLDTAGDIARLVGHQGIVKFVNGILRSYLRKIEKQLGREDSSETLNPDDLPIDNKSAGQLSRQYSMPEWLVKRWLISFGQEETISLLVHCQTPPKLTLRANTMAIETDALAQILERQGLKLSRSRLVDSCLIVESKNKNQRKLEELPGYNEGIFSVQDESAAFVAQVVAPQAGEVIIDLCAAPGGKTINMAELMDGKGRIIAVDIHDKRLNLLRDSRLRMGLRNIETKASDGRQFKYAGGADRVLVDAPCSGTGVIAKRADLRSNRDESDLEKLTKIQAALLENAANLLKEGGVLVYSTCSIEKEEGPDVINAFLQNHPEFSRDDISNAFPDGLLAELELEEEAANGEVMFLPSRHKLPGFYIARLRKSV